MKTYVLYHANCSDGFCAAWVARAHVGEDAVYVPVQHGCDMPPMDDGSTVYLLDFCYPRANIIDLIDRMARVVILDHHKTAQAALDGVADACAAKAPTINFDMESSGARLAWNHFNPGVESPWIIDYVEDRDLWRWRLPNSQAINAWLHSWPLDFAVWTRLFMDHCQRVWPSWVAAGEAILRNNRKVVEDHVARARKITLDGHEILAVNASLLFSEIAGELAVGRPFGACYFDRADGKRQWSLRSTPTGLDVSVIAKNHGGGGHKHAAGFEESV